MAEYIKREAAIAAINKFKGPTRSPAQNDLIWGAIKLVERIPSADVAPVRHGRWQTLTGNPTPRCTACYKEAVKLWHGGWYTPDHCPNCGAQMDGGKEDG